ncbi:UDP-glucuronosyltransferase 1-2-like [Diadema antillarum]|uniref:UDP-glucuronosyltransferase 1-2-like n=1 Tax=Diadema antillarum TaxID=105358 RepID=UPI003A8AFB41
MSLQHLLCVLLILRSGANDAEAANILMSGGLGEGSHFLALVPIGKSLVERGHNVTFLISEEYSFRAADPVLGALFDFEIFSYNDTEYKAQTFFDAAADIASFGTNGLVQNFEIARLAKRVVVDTCVWILSDKDLMKRLESMDAIVAEMPWPCAGFVKSYLSRHTHSQVRFILSSATAPISSMLTLAGSPFNTAYQPSSLTGLTSSMTLLQRMKNTIYYLMMRVLMDMYIKMFAEIVDKFDLNPSLKQSLMSFSDEIDLYLVNMDFAVEFPFPLTPNIIPIGGVTTGPAGPLTGDLLEFIDQSGEHGVVILAMGSYFASFTSSRPDLFKMFIDAFSRIPQRVILQLKTMPAYSLPPNVKAMPWLPQNDLLGHPKTKAFVFHAGNNGYFEALFHGIPMLAVPLFGDHFDVAARIQSRGIGIVLTKDELNADLIYEKLSEILHDERYAKTAARLSAIFKDRPLRPAERAAFWIEHVIKHGGEHMRSTVNDLNFLQYSLIDVAMICIVVSSIFVQLLVPLRHLHTNAKPKFITAMYRCFNARHRSSNPVSARKTLTAAPPKFVQRLITARAKPAKQ